jgi:hypothetical protein
MHYTYTSYHPKGDKVICFQYLTIVDTTYTKYCSMHIFVYSNVCIYRIND